MTKRLLLTFATAALMASGAAQAEIRVSVSRYDHGALKIEGQTAPNRIVTLDGRFKAQSDGGGYFRFDEKGYKPDDCMSDLVADNDIYSAVIAGCFGEFSIENEKPKTAAPPG
jgi:hypothetical protein